MRRSLPVVLACALAGAAVVLPGCSSASSAVEPHTTPAPWSPMKGIAVQVWRQYNLTDTQDRLTDAETMRKATQLFSMLRDQLHANAVSLNFPFWQSSSKSSDPERAAMTPSPERLALLTAVAHRYGLSVQYRPFLFEGDLTRYSRPSIDPANVALWFRNYWRFLQPYLASANAAGASSFSVALEFTSLLGYLSDWERLVAQARGVYPGELVYSQQHDPEQTIPLTARGYDAYQPVYLKSPRQVSVAAFTKGFVNNLQMSTDKTAACPQCSPMQSAPRDLIVEELGIPAVAGAYDQPNVFAYPASTPVDRPVQTDWFAGACNAFRQLHLAGIYFWSIDLNTYTPAENSARSIYNWLKTPSATAIATCFARIP